MHVRKKSLAKTPRLSALQSPSPTRRPLCPAASPNSTDNSLSASARPSANGIGNGSGSNGAYNGNGNGFGLLGCKPFAAQKLDLESPPKPAPTLAFPALGVASLTPAQVPTGLLPPAASAGAAGSAEAKFVPSLPFGLPLGPGATNLQQLGGANQFANMYVSG